MVGIPNNQLSQVGRFRGYACPARQTHTTIVHPATSMLCAVRLPITKNKAHIVETGLEYITAYVILAPSPMLLL